MKLVCAVTETSPSNTILLTLSGVPPVITLLFSFLHVLDTAGKKWEWQWRGQNLIHRTHGHCLYDQALLLQEQFYWCNCKIRTKREGSELVQREVYKSSDKTREVPLLCYIFVMFFCQEWHRFACISVGWLYKKAFLLILCLYHSYLITTKMSRFLGADRVKSWFWWCISCPRKNLLRLSQPKCSLTVTLLNWERWSSPQLTQTALPGRRQELLCKHLHFQGSWAQSQVQLSSLVTLQ